MKKYISFLILIATFLLQSCERPDSDLNVSEQRELNTEALSNKESVMNKNEGSEEKNPENMETGDDEPKRDKQHWRVVNDTI